MDYINGGCRNVNEAKKETLVIMFNIADGRHQTIR